MFKETDEPKNGRKSILHEPVQNPIKKDDSKRLFSNQNTSATSALFNNEQELKTRLDVADVPSSHIQYFPVKEINKSTKEFFIFQTQTSEISINFSLKTVRFIVLHISLNFWFLLTQK